MEKKSPETSTVTDFVGRESETARHVGVTPSILDSIFRQTRLVDSIMNPAIARLLASMSLSFPSPKLVDDARRQAQLYGTINRHLASVLASSAPLAQFAQISAQLGAQVQAVLNSLYVDIDRLFSNALLPIKEIADRIGESSRVGDAFRHYSLWLAPSMSEELIAKIVSLYELGARSGTVHSVVSRYYAKDNWQRLEDVLKGCRNNSLFKRRIKVIEEALQAHRGGLYSVSVPALLIQLEGISADYVKKHNLLPRVGGQTREIIVTALEDTPYSLLDVRTYAGVGALIEYVENSMFVFVDFDKEHLRLQGESKLQGHAVRHGRQVAFGSRMNSLRLFLFIDVLTSLKD